MGVDLEEIFEQIKKYIRFSYDEETINYQSHITLYQIAQECCYGLNESELRCLHNACEEILEDRRN